MSEEFAQWFEALTEPQAEEVATALDLVAATSTLRRVVEALGGELEITAVFGKRRVKITDA